MLGLDQVAKSSQGHFIPQVTGLPPAPLARPVKYVQKPDIIDMLAPKAARSKEVKVTDIAGAFVASAGNNIFSVIAKVEDESRATEYLDRLKLALEKEPGKVSCLSA